MNALQTYLHRHVDVRRFYETELEEFIVGQNNMCPFHEDTKPSLSVDTDGIGQYYCHSASCGVHGTSFVGFYTQLHGVPYDLALQQLYAKYIRPTIPVDTVLEYHHRLLQAPAVQEWLVDNRGITLETIRFFKMGYADGRVTIPIENQFDMIVNVRRYDISKKSEAKMISYQKGYGGATLFPTNLLDRDDVIIVEGELDAILGNQLGFPCICSTGGAGYWSAEFSELLRGKNITILMDNDDAGHKGAQLVATSLAKYAACVKLAEYPFECDLTDFIVRHHKTGADLGAIIKEAKVLHINEYMSGDILYTHVRLQDAALPKYRGKPIEFKACVIGKDTQPYYVPKKIRTTCLTRPDRKCAACRGPEPYTSIKTIEANDERMLGFINTTEGRLTKALQKCAGCNSSCEVEVKIEETMCCEEVKLVAPLDEVGTDEEFKYVVRRAYVMGQEVNANATYIFRAYPYPDPNTQHVVFLIIDSQPAADQLDHYQLVDEDIKLLREHFPGGNDVETIHQFLTDLYTYFAVSTTKIYERRALHQAVDLVFHSALSFNFNGEFIRRGWLDVLVMGDTRTGKGYVTERLCRYYGAGEVASGENCTFSGLVGGVQQIGSRQSWVVTWGFLPRNDRRLGVIDEAGSVTSETLSRMSRARSEGVAEVFKIVTERTMARTRIIWNANPTDGRSIREFEYGIEAVATLTDKKEDIARFDYAVIVSSDEIDPRIINASRPDFDSVRPRLQEACRKLIQWTWSRRPNEVVFESDATRRILEDATILGKEYHPSIPLIQIENIRIKLAKIATAIAARVFSASEDGMKIIVTKACAEYAAGFLRYLYTLEVSAYDVYSDLKREQGTIASEDQLLQLFATYKGRGKQWVNTLLDTQKISVKTIEAGLNLDFQSAKDIRNELVSLRAIKQQHSYWVKREPFIRILRQLRIRYIREPNWWKEV